jgi:MoxR-like ATPase
MTIDPTALSTSAAALRAFQAALNGAFFERGDEVRALLLALISREHLLLLGPPGTAKSALANVLSGALGARYCSRLLSRLSVYEEVFGPLSLSGLERDEYRRIPTGYVQEAEVVFLDEIFKSNSALLNSFLTILNERTFTDNGVTVKVPLEVAIGASNELPEDESLAALYDRFLFRRWVSYLGSRDNRRALLLARREPEIACTLDRSDLDLLRAAREEVSLDGVVDLILDAAETLSREHGISISDRRLRKSTKAVQAAAVLGGRLVAEPADLLVLADIWWDKPEDRAAVYGTLAKIASPDLEEALRLLDAATEAYAKVDARVTTSQTVGGLQTANVAIKGALGEVEKLSRSVEIVEIEKKIRGMQREIASTVARLIGL